MLREKNIRSYHARPPARCGQGHTPLHNLAIHSRDNPEALGRVQATGDHDLTSRPKPIDDGEWIRGITPEIMAARFRLVNSSNLPRCMYTRYIYIIIYDYIYVCVYGKMNVDDI